MQNAGKRKKRKKRKNFKTILLLCLIGFMYTNCEKDEHVDQDEHDHPHAHVGATEIDYISGDDDPGIMDILDAQTGDVSNKSISSKTVRYKKTWIDLKKIMKVKNHENITNYSMAVYVEDGPEHIWYNAVINENDKGKKKEAYIVKYASTPENHAYYMENGENFKDFVGTRTVMTFNEFYRSLDVSAKSERIAHGDCPPIEYWGRISRGHSGDFGDIPEGVIVMPKLYSIGTSGSSNTFDWDMRFDHNGQEESFMQRYIQKQNLRGVEVAIHRFYRPWEYEDPFTVHPNDNGWLTTTTQNLDWMESNGVGGTIFTMTKAYSYGTTVQSELMQRLMDDVSKAPVNSKTSHTCTIEAGEIGVELPDLHEWALSNIVDVFRSVGRELTTSQLNWCNDRFNRDLYKVNAHLVENHTSQGVNFASEGMDAYIADGTVDWDELYISNDVPDTASPAQGSTMLIPASLTLSNGNVVQVKFVTYTTDGLGSNNQVSVDLVDGLKAGLLEANTNLSSANRITSINVYATTNGSHTGPNHGNGQAIDINRINGKRMAVTGLTVQIKELQKGFDKFNLVRENFGPYFKHKYFIGTNVWNYNYPVSGHKDHIHFSIRR